VIFSSVWYNQVSVLGSCDYLLCVAITCLYYVFVIVSTVYYYHVFILGSYDFLRCVVQLRVCTT